MKKIDGMNLLPCHNTWSYATQSYRITSVCKFALCNTYIFFQTITKNPPSKIYYRNDYFCIDFFVISKEKNKIYYLIESYLTIKQINGTKLNWKLKLPINFYSNK